MTLKEIANLRALIEKNGAPLSPMLIFTLLNHLETSLRAIFDLHFDSGGGYCAECSSWEEGVKLPCPTILAVSEGPA